MGMPPPGPQGNRPVHPSEMRRGSGQGRQFPSDEMVYRPDMMQREFEVIILNENIPRRRPPEGGAGAAGKENNVAAGGGGGGMTPRQEKSRDAAHRPLKEAETCKICYTDRISTAFVPCGHSTCCIECAKRSIRATGKCPICKTRKAAILKLYRE